MAIPVVQGVLDVISKGIEYLTLLSKTSHVRRLRKAVDWGESFILNYEELEKETDEKKIKNIKAKMALDRKNFFKYNQG